MGLFSSRKEDNETAVGFAGKKEDKSMVQVIRSRLYGKKGKERENPKLSYENVPPPSVSSGSLANNKHSSRTNISGSSIRRSILERSLPSNEKRGHSDDPAPSPRSVRSNRVIGSSPLAQKASASSTSIASPRNTDTVTVTLAQRLNELSWANSEGLLSDDEYRILRQNLFERFSSNALVPTEASIVPADSHLSPTKANHERPTSRPLSNFQVDRPPSIISKSSTTSSGNGLFRRATERHSNAKDTNETASVMSAKSNTSLFKIPRMLSRKASDVSIRTAASRGQTDTISVSSRRISFDKGHADQSVVSLSPHSTAGSIRRMQVPPSSFNARLIPQSQDRHSAIYNVFDENHLSTVQDIHQEISNVEAEQKRLMDAFNGLEVTTLARSHRHRIPPSKRSMEFSKASNVTDSIWGDSDGRSQGRMNLADDGNSVRSGTSIGTAASLARSVYSSKNGLRTKGSLPSPLASSPPPLPLLRRGSLSNADERKTPIPSKSNSVSQGLLQATNSSALSLHSRGSRLAVNVLPDDEKSVTTVHIDDSDALEVELEDIRRRREEVNHRYEARLEYLRAKLKGAQLHERVLRR